MPAAAVLALATSIVGLPLLVVILLLDVVNPLDVGHLCGCARERTLSAALGGLRSLAVNEERIKRGRHALRLWRAGHQTATTYGFRLYSRAGQTQPRQPQPSRVMRRIRPPFARPPARQTLKPCLAKKPRNNAA